MKTFMCLLFGCWAVAQAAPPVVFNIRASQRPGTKLVDVYYDLADADGDLQLNMPGNLWEWTWDCYSSSYYGTPASLTNPLGPASGSSRVFRGGDWSNLAGGCQVAFRADRGPGIQDDRFGFRTVRR